MLVLLVSVGAAATPFRLPAGEAPEAWQEALALAGFEAGSGHPGVEVKAVGDAWTLLVWDDRGVLRTAEVPRPTSERGREDLVWLAVSLAQAGKVPGLPRAVAVPPVPVVKSPPPKPRASPSPPDRPPAPLLAAALPELAALPDLPLPPLAPSAPVGLSGEPSLATLLPEHIAPPLRISASLTGMALFHAGLGPTLGGALA